MVPSQIASLFCQFSNIHILFLILFLLSWFYLPVYNIPAASKAIGYTRVLIGKKYIDLFYPCLEKSAVSSKPLFPSGVWNIMYEIVNKDS